MVEGDLIASRNIPRERGRDRRRGRRWEETPFRSLVRGLMEFEKGVILVALPSIFQIDANKREVVQVHQS
jgi:hypothetical protein